MNVNHEIDLTLPRVAAALKSALAPSIRLHRRAVPAGSLSPSSSKLGFLPDLPNGIEPPTANGRPMDLLARFNCAELFRADTAHLLPSTGMLYFFISINHEADSPIPWGSAASDRGRWRAVYVQAVPAAAPSKPSREEQRTTEYALTFSAESTLPAMGSAEVNALHLTDDEWWQYWELRARHVGAAPGEPVERVLGYADPIQGDPLEKVFSMNPNRSARWLLLLQLDSDEGLGWMWGDIGRIHLFIRENDLAARKFDDLWGIVQD